MSQSAMLESENNNSNLNINVLWDKAERGDALRRRREYIKAIEELTQLIHELTNHLEPHGNLKLEDYIEVLCFAYARRGAAKLGIGYLTEKILAPLPSKNKALDKPELTCCAAEDLRYAAFLADSYDHLYPSNIYGWAWAQLGDAYRIFARDSFALLGRKEFDACIEGAVECFHKIASDKKVMSVFERPEWLCAHLGATYITKIFRLWKIEVKAEAPKPERSLFQHFISDRSEGNDGSEQYKQAKEDYEQARDYLNLALDGGSLPVGEGGSIEVSGDKSYVWAHRFRVLVDTLGVARKQSTYDEVMRDLGKATAMGGVSHLRDMCALSLFASYEGRRLADEGNMDEAEKMYILAQRAGQQFLHEDPEDCFALYAHAAALISLNNHWRENRFFDTEAYAMQTCKMLLNNAKRFILMSYSLFQRSRDQSSAGDFAAMAKALFHKEELFDMETLSIAHLHPVWSLQTREQKRELAEVVEKLFMKPDLQST